MATSFDPDNPAVGDNGQLRSVEEMIALGVEFPNSPSSPSKPLPVATAPEADTSSSEASDDDSTHVVQGERRGQCTRIARVREDPSIPLLEEKAKKKKGHQNGKGTSSITSNAFEMFFKKPAGRARDDPDSDDNTDDEHPVPKTGNTSKSKSKTVDKHKKAPQGEAVKKDKKKVCNLHIC